jgi:hemerythrin superfamily protein
VKKKETLRVKEYMKQREIKLSQNLLKEERSKKRRERAFYNNLTKHLAIEEGSLDDSDEEQVS